LILIAVRSAAKRRLHFTCHSKNAKFSCQVAGNDYKIHGGRALHFRILRRGGVALAIVGVISLPTDAPVSSFAQEANDPPGAKSHNNVRQGARITVSRIDSQFAKLSALREELRALHHDVARPRAVSGGDARGPRSDC
jgi:hypothetical protein